jgi:hypothetical protein
MIRRATRCGRLVPAVRGGGGPVVVLLLSLAAAPALSAERDSGGGGPRLHSSLDVGFGNVDEDAFALIYLEQGFSWSGLELVLSGPFRLRTVDRNPRDAGVLREQDWDEPSDFARIARELRFERDWDGGRLALRFGELNGVGIGHGSVVDGYFNSTDMDHYQGGALLAGEHEGNGLELMIENVVAPEIYAGRIFLAPIAWFSGDDWARRLTLGYTLAADISVPRHLPSADGTRLRRTAIPVTGGDVALRLVDASRVGVEPYFDVMVMDGDPGIHAGAATRWLLAEAEELELLVRAEYRWSGSDYHPALFGPFYDHLRRRYDRHPDTGEIRSLADNLAEEEQEPAHGGLVDLVFSWGDLLRIGGRYDAEGRKRPHRLMLRLGVAPSEMLDLELFYAGRDATAGAGLFSWNSLFGASISSNLWDPLRLFVDFSRRWRRAGGRERMANESGVGFGVVLVY